MGKCTYCGNPAGFLKKHHKVCKEKYDNGLQKMLSLAQEAVVSGQGLQSLQGQLSDIAEGSFVEKDRVQETLINAWEHGVEVFLDDGVLTEEEEDKLDKYKEYFDFSQDDLDNNRAYTRVGQAAILREILEGKIPERINIEGDIPFNLQKSEVMVWLFQDVSYYEQKTRREFSGGHQGFSVRIAKGVYYRAGAFKGRPVETTETVLVDIGLLGFTNKHLYFSGDSKSFRIKYDKIVTFTPYEDGIGVQRDAATAKPQIFETGDGWFTYNLTTNLAQLENN